MLMESSYRTSGRVVASVNIDMIITGLEHDFETRREAAREPA